MTKNDALRDAAVHAKRNERPVTVWQSRATGRWHYALSHLAPVLLKHNPAADGTQQEVEP